MKRGNWVVRLVFTILGSIYALVGGGFLIYAVGKAGALSRIYSLAEDDLALAVIGSVFALLGVIFLLVAGIILLLDKRQQRLREELLTWGTRVTGVVTEVSIDRSVRVKNRNPYRAKVRCTLPLGEKTLRSPMLWVHVPVVGEEVPVVYDPMDERRTVILFPEE